MFKVKEIVQRLSQLWINTFRSRRWLTRNSEDVQRFLDHPKPKSWINALSDHPALASQRLPDKDVLLDIYKRENKSEKLSQLTTEQKPEPLNDELNVETTLEETYEVETDEEVTIEKDTEETNETWEYETVYEKEELVGAIGQWLSKISDSSRAPWDDKDATDSFPVLRSSIKLDPFHQFDWSQTGRSHTGRLVSDDSLIYIIVSSCH